MLVVIRGHGPDGRCDGPSLEECVLLLQKITEHHGGYTAVAAVIFLSLSGGILGTAVKLGNQLQFCPVRISCGLPRKTPRIPEARVCWYTTPHSLTVNRTRKVAC